MINFYKYQGTGNDFVIIDNRWGKIELTAKQIKFICDRQFGVGADGLILLENCDGFDFKMVYYNSDGNESTMCGNGGRCIVSFAQKLGIIDEHCLFQAIDGEHQAKTENGLVHLKMGNVNKIEKGEDYFYMDTGSPHYILFKSSVEELNIQNEAQEIRYNERFKLIGTNVNFVEVVKGSARIRTYERGVEGETLSCGTGATACAIALNLLLPNEYNGNCMLITNGGELQVKFKKVDNNHFEDIWLVGRADFVFKGILNV